ncbi:unnamed protein product, partial [Prunus brigantina]
SLLSPRSSLPCVLPQPNLHNHPSAVTNHLTGPDHTSRLPPSTSVDPNACCRPDFAGKPRKLPVFVRKFTAFDLRHPATKSDE